MKKGNFMKKTPVEVSIHEMKDILENYLSSETKLNYAIKILGHPGVGKSALVKQIAAERNFHFIDTRLAFKENIDLGGYPVPDHENKRMIYFRPQFIPPVEVPHGFSGIVWFLDEANRAHPTVIQTLFQIITEGMCGEHRLPERTFIVLAGNLGEEDSTTITEFDDSALDGRLAVFHLKPRSSDWLVWANKENIHPSVIKYISMFPEQLWNEEMINPNPRGWHQISMSLYESYNCGNEELLIDLLQDSASTIHKIIYSLIGFVTGRDFIEQNIRTRDITTADILSGNRQKLQKVIQDDLTSEDLMWSLYGAISYFRKEREQSIEMQPTLKEEVAYYLLFLSHSRSDIAMSLFYLLIKECGIFSQIPDIIKTIDNQKDKSFILSKIDSFMA
jgi:hypothetical protein